MNRQKIRLILGSCLILLCSSLNSCVSVAAYQQMYLQDNDMKLAPRNVALYEQNMEAYREGAAGGNSSKSGGGCGCN